MSNIWCVKVFGMSSSPITRNVFVSMPSLFFYCEIRLQSIIFLHLLCFCAADMESSFYLVAFLYIFYDLMLFYLLILWKNLYLISLICCVTIDPNSLYFIYHFLVMFIVLFIFLILWKFCILQDSLFRCLRTMASIHGAAYNFLPQTFVLPMDYTKFVRVYAAEEESGCKVCLSIFSRHVLCYQCIEF